MSGVFGVIDPTQQTNFHTFINDMSTVLTHGDWFVTNHFVSEQSNLAMGRVAIGIFNKGLQPVWNATHTVALMMAGEFYNQAKFSHHDLKSDEQLALSLYEELGPDFVSRLEGIFIIAIWDENRQQFLLLNDHFGIYPMFITQVGARFLFAPEIKALLIDRTVNRSLQNEAIAEFMRFQRLLGQKTFFKNITALPPATILTYHYQTATYQMQCYWNIGQIAFLPKNITFNEAVEEGGRLFRQSVEKRVKNSERTGVYLSGGLDSRAILGFIPPSAGQVHTFTFGQPGCQDEYYARQIAQTAGACHHFDPYTDGHWIKEFFDLHLELTEGFHPWIHMHGIKMLKEARQHVDVNLSGLGDFLWRPQSRFRPLYLVKAPDDIAFNAILFDLYNQKYSWPGLTYPEERYLYHESFLPQVKDLAFESFVKEVTLLSNLPSQIRAASFNLLNHFTRHLLWSAVFGRSHIEYRFPYCDLPLLSFCYGLPIELAGDRALQRAIIIKELPRLASIPSASDELPITNRYKRRLFAKITQKLKNGVNRYISPIFPKRATLYADYENYLRHELREWAENILFDERTLSRGIFRPEALRSLMNRHVAGYQEWTIGKISHLITFEMMLRRFVD